WNKWMGASMPAPEFDKSRQYYEQAIELDRNYALAYAGLADFYGFAFGFGLLPPEEKWAKAQEDNAKKALELDPTLGEAYNSLASDKLYVHRDWPAAERNFRRGLELSPNFAEMHAHYGFCLISLRPQCRSACRDAARPRPRSAVAPVGFLDGATHLL